MEVRFVDRKRAQTPDGGWGYVVVLASSIIMVKAIFIVVSACLSYSVADCYFSPYRRFWNHLRGYPGRPHQWYYFDDQYFQHHQLLYG